MISLVILLSLFLYFLLYHLYLKRRELPPGPLPFPLLGNVPQMLVGDPYDTLIRWYTKYGRTFTIWIGPKPFVVVCGYEQLKETMVNRFETFAGRERHFFTEYFFGGKYGILMADGIIWQHQRRFSLRALRDLGFGRKANEEKLMTQIKRMLRDIDQTILKSNVCSLDLSIELCATNVINNMMFGYEFEATDPKFYSTNHLLTEHLPLLITFRTGMMLYYPILRFLPFFNSMFKRIKEGHDSILDFYRAEIQRHKDNFVPTDQPKDFIDACLMEMHRREENGESLGHFSDWQLLRTCYDLWPAGTENSVNTLRWAMLYMIRFPQVQEKIQAEIDNTVKEKELVCYEDRNRMPYTCATINEIQRHANILFFNAPRETTKPCELNGYYLPAKMAILQMTSQPHMDDKYFPEPRKFMPERFLDSNGEVINCPQLMPFSIGKRSCMGISLAKMELFLILANVLNKFNLSVPPGQQEPSLRRNLGVTLKPCKHDCYVEIRK